jgi:type I restriction enzyme R subunit
MIAEYNSGSSNVEEHFQGLLDFTQGLSAEDSRALSERLSEEELAVYDLLTRPQVILTAQEVKDVKRVAQELLATLNREKLVLDWRKKPQSRAGVRLAVEEMLDRLPAAYTTDLYQTKCEQVYQHVYDSYAGDGRSVYSSIAP